MVSRSQQRAFTAAAIVIAAIVVSWVVYGGSGYIVNAEFDTGGQLVKGDGVTVGGQPIGTIKDITLTDDNHALVRMEIQNGNFDPLHEGTVATVRSLGQAGVANRYIALQPGPNSAPKIASGGVIRADNTNAPIDLDQLLDALNEDAREGLKDIVKGSNDIFKDDPDTPLNEAVYGNRALLELTPALAAGSRLAANIAQDQVALGKFITETSQAVETVASQKEALAATISDINAFSRSIAAEREALDQAFAVLPQALRDGQETFKVLRPTLDALEKLAEVGTPATKNLAPFLRELRPLIRNADPTIADLSAIVRRKGKNNDLTELLALQPEMAKQASALYPSAITAMQRSTPMISFLRPYAPELTSWITHFGQIASNYDASGHYVRAGLVVGTFSRSTLPGTLTALSPGQAMSEFPKTGTKRCPGSGQQSAGDASNPFLDTPGFDCDASAVLPGP